MGSKLAAETGGLIILFLRVDLASGNTNGAFHIYQHGAVGCYYHAATADMGILIHAYGGTDQISVGIIREKATDDIQCLMGVASLMRAADDDIEILLRQRRERLVEVKVIAGQKAVADTVDGQNIRLDRTIDVRAVQR